MLGLYKAANEAKLMETKSIDGRLDEIVEMGKSRSKSAIIDLLAEWYQAGYLQGIEDAKGTQE